MSTTYTATPDTLAGGDVLAVTNPTDGDALTAASNNVAVQTIANRVKGINDLLASSRARSKFYAANQAELTNCTLASGGNRAMKAIVDSAAAAAVVRFAVWDIPYRAVITQIQPIGVNNSAGLLGVTAYAAKVDSLASFTALENGGAGQSLIVAASGGTIPLIPLTATAASKTWSNASGSEYLVVVLSFTGSGASTFSINGLQVNYTIIGP